MPAIIPVVGAVAGSVANKALGGGGGQTGSGAVGTPYNQRAATQGQAVTAYDQTQSGLAQQQAFANAVAAQNGLGNQSQVYNQLQGVVNGTGPNPAMAALNQATGANTANQAALMAGQRGTGANAGLLARQAAMQGGANQQAAAGQGATMQAQQSLNAMGQAGALANQQAGQQANALMGYNQAAQGQQSNIMGAIGQENAGNIAMQSNINNANAGIAQQNNQGNINANGGLAKGMGAAFGAGLGALTGGGNNSGTKLTGGPGDIGSAPMVTYAASGGEVPSHASFVGRHLAGMPQTRMAEGGTVPALLSPGESYLTPAKVNKVAQAKDKGGEIKKVAEKIPGKASVKGDSLKNDTVPRDLEPGGIVIPRSVMQSDNPTLEAHKFVAAILARQNLKKK